MPPWRVRRICEHPSPGVARGIDERSRATPGIGGGRLDGPTVAGRMGGGASRRGHVDAAGVATMDGDGSDMRFNVPEPDCAPHPLDIMALYALYQTR